MYCTKCGVQIAKDATFCTNCGNRTGNPMSTKTVIKDNRPRCPHCGSKNINIQIVTESKLKTKHHSIFYWLFIGWWLELLLWFFLTIPRLLIFIFMPKKQKLTQKQRKIAICQNCGYSWNK